MNTQETHTLGIDEAARLSTTPHHELRNLTAFTGAVVGATVGAVGGIPGMAVGALVMGVGAVLSGVVLEHENLRAAAHDRELDDAIGVTSSELGAAGPAAVALDALESTIHVEEEVRHEEWLALSAELDDPAPDTIRT